MKYLKFFGSVIFFLFIFIICLFIEIKPIRAFNQNICANFKITATGGYNRTDGPTLEQSTYNSPYSFPVAKPMILGQGSPVVSFKATPTKFFSGQAQVTLMRYDYRADSHGGNGTKSVDNSFFKYGETSLYTVGDFNYPGFSSIYGYNDPVYDTGRTNQTWTNLMQVVPDMVAYKAFITYPNYTQCESDKVYVKMAGYFFNTANITHNDLGETILNYSVTNGGNYFTIPPIFRKGNGNLVAVKIYDATIGTNEWFSPLWKGNSYWLSGDNNVGLFWGKDTPVGIAISGNINLGKFYQNLDANKKIGIFTMGDPIEWTQNITSDTKCPSPFSFLNPNYCYVVTGYQELTPYFLPPAYNLDVSKSGTGSGTVASNPTGVNCGTDCTEIYNNGTIVTLTTTADAGSNFIGWTGACTGVGDCIVTMNSSKSVTAVFDLIPQIKPTVYTDSYEPLSSSSVKINGRVADFGSSSGMDRGFYVSADGTCDTNDTKYSVPPVSSTGNMSYTLTGWTQGWGYYMAYAKNNNLSNNFDQGSCNRFEIPATYKLLITSVTGNGAVTGTGGINCRSGGSGTCQVDLSVNSAATIVANPDTNWKWQSWGGADCSGSGSTCNLIMNSDKSASATFVNTAAITSSGLSVTVTWLENGETKQVNLKTDLFK
jgi:hypothetical protein